METDPRKPSRTRARSNVWRSNDSTSGWEDGTIRKAYAESIEANSVHGSDSDENAKTEIAFFFNDDEIVG